jgi:hypothetical protein
VRALVLLIEDANQHRRHAQHDGSPFAFEEFEHVISLKTGWNDKGASSLERP